MNYSKLMQHNPTSYGEMINSLGQFIEFYEHPLKGDEFPIICVNHSLRIAAASDFFETDDMMASHREYEPSFQDGKLFIGQFEA